MQLGQSSESTPAKGEAASTRGCSSATSETRASSSPASLRYPGTPWSAQRALGEVFNMATPDTDPTVGAQSPEGSHVSPVVKQLAGSGSPLRGVCLRLSSRLDRTGSPGDENQQAQADAWNLEEWESCAASSSNTRPHSAANKLDKQQLEVADAVVGELQVDIESVIQKAVNHLSSWISAEVAFARHGLESEVQAVAAQTRAMNAKHEVGFSHSQVQLASKVELLQTDVRELALAIGKVQESTHREPAEDDSFLHKVKAVEATLHDNSKTIEALSRQVTYCDAMLVASRKDVDRHASELTRLVDRTGDMRSDLQTNDARTDLVAWELQQLHTLLSGELSKKASFEEVNSTAMAIKAWVDEGHKVHHASVEELTRVFEQCRASSLAQSDVLNRHEAWMKELTCLL